MYRSDPEVSKQFGEYQTFWEIPPVFFVPCGRLHGGPSYYTVDAVWDDLVPVDEGQLALFKDVWLKREYAQKFVPTAILTDWVQTTMPKIQVNNAHFRSNKFTIPQTVYFNMTWYLFYGSGGGVSGYQFLDPPEDYSSLSASLLDYDSIGTADAYFGWTLMLIRQIFTIAPDAPPDSPPQVEYHIYGTWSLAQPNTPAFTQAAGEAIFTPEEKTLWYPYRNPLNFPPHHLVLTPWQP